MDSHSNDNWNADLYDEKHAFVSNFGNDLVKLLNPRKGEKILDIGCGTGDLAKRLSDCGSDVIGIDQSENMVSQAKEKYPNLTFIVQDVADMSYDYEFDAVFSNATLHWVKQSKQALRCIFKSLKQGGRFIAEFGGKGNVQIIADEVIKQIKKSGFKWNEEQFPWYFPSIGEYTSLMEETGFRVTFAQHFDRPTLLDGDEGLRNWIEMFCSGMFEGIDHKSKDNIVLNVEGEVKSRLYKDGQWMADYKRIRVIGVKE
ncbi:SAM-dependent methyltransferase [Pueribacillus theae]|uniref:SAM-dependent methyltransferase n=1 Tax=Pueribacillus theae TaxID=2171751 RepID=A0A2U1K1T8_9BACI|nr:class I SAM-dependent methyltransferase [Pueribacillus theae]PWA11154.1 SAM-dependent methyltransferase [Pueribacillus theae]